MRQKARQGCIGCLLILSAIGCNVLYAQMTNLGQPFVDQYTKNTYRAGLQSWGFAQTDRGVLLVANNDGLLVYDGMEWSTHHLPNRTIARSVLHTSDGHTYIGGQDEFGYFAPDARGSYRFHSLKDSLPASVRTFADVWDIAAADGQVFFRASDRLHYVGPRGNGVVESEFPLAFLTGQDDWLYAHTQGQGILAKPPGAEFRLLPGTEALAEGPITAIVRLTADSLLIATERAGLYIWQRDRLFPWSFDQDNFVRQNRITDLALLADRQLVIGTELGGALVVDLSARQTRYWLHQSNGLQNNIVRSVFVDRNDDIWLGLNNGIDHIQTSLPYRRFAPGGEQASATYAIRIADDHLYVGTADGLWQAEWKPYYDPFSSEPVFRKVPGTAGQVWGLDIIDNRIWIGHQEGALLLDANEVQRISPGIGYWKYLPYREDYLIAGTYDGLTIYQNEGDQWSYRNDLTGLNESCRILEVDDQHHIWMAHPYRGIYRLRPDSALQSVEVTFYGQEQGLPSDLNNYVFRIADQIIVCAEQGIYRYAPEQDMFLLDEQFTHLFGPAVNMRRLYPDADGDIWFVSADNTGIIDLTDEGLSKSVAIHTLSPVRPYLVGGFELIYPYSRDHVFFGTEQGVVQYHHDTTLDSLLGPAAILSEVRTIGPSDSLLWNGLFAKAAIVHTQPYASGQNAFRFRYSASHFSNFQKVTYQYQLVGLDEDWSAWTTDREREYTNLAAGDYSFRVRARVEDGAPGLPASYAFSIAPPWYQSLWAWLLYGGLFIVGLWAIISLPRRKYEREKAALQQQQARQAAAHRQQVQVSEQTIEELKTEKLQAEVDYKSRELASLAMHLVQKNELLNKIGDQVEKISRHTTERKIVQELKTLLRQNARMDDDWENFALHFDQVHAGFLSRLREAYPQLTPKDHRLSAYLRMNLSTKEIAPLLNISVRGVEIGRYRLRKKMGLENSVNLNEFMMDF